MNSCVMVQAGNSVQSGADGWHMWPVCFSKESVEKALWSLLTHMCEQMQACYDINALCAMFHPLCVSPSGGGK